MIIKDIIKSPTKIRIYFFVLAALLVIFIAANYYLLPKNFIYFGAVYEGAMPSYYK